MQPIVSQLDNVQRHGKFYRATCPICSSNDGKTKRNLSVRIENGACKCHRCGAKTREVREALGGRVVRPNTTVPVLPTSNEPREWNTARDRHAIAFYEFETIEGIRVQHVKFPESDKYPRYSWRHFKHGTWYNGMGDNTPYLFHQADVAKASIVFIVEGEKDAGRGKFEFRAAGYGHEFAFTTSHTGAGAGTVYLAERINKLSEQIANTDEEEDVSDLVYAKYQLIRELKSARQDSNPLKPHQLDQLRDKIVYLIGDNDTAGKEGVQAKYAQLTREGIDVHIIPLPVTQEKADLSDAFDDWYTVNELLIDAKLINRPEVQPLSLYTDLSHTCGAQCNAFTAIIHSDHTQIAAWKPQKWRTCDACFDERIGRFSMQIRFQQKKHVLYYSQWNNSEWKRKRDAWRKRRKRNKSAEIYYTSFPQPDGSLIVIHNIEKDGDEEMPTDPLEIKVLLNAWALTPIGKAIGNSRNGFGGDYRGTKGNQSEAARAAREAERERLYKLVCKSIANVTPDVAQSGIVNMSAKSIADLLPYISDREALCWLYYEYHNGKKRVTVLKRILNRLHALKPCSGLSVQIFGWGRNAVAKALSIELESGTATVKIDVLTAIQIITDSATKYFVRGGGRAINREMSAFLDIDQVQENTILESGHFQSESNFEVLNVGQESAFATR